MGRIFKLEYKSKSMPSKNRMFFIQKFTIDDICEMHGEYYISYGYINFKDNIKKIKRKYNYNKKYDSFYCYEIVGGVKKLLKSVSSTKNKLVEEEQNMEETNFAKKVFIEHLNSIIREDIEEEETSIQFVRKEGIIMQQIKNVYINEKEGVTVVVFDNGDKVKVTREKSEKNDIEKAIAIAIIKHYFGLAYYINACDKVINAEKKAKPEKKEKTKPTIKPRSKKQQINPEKEVK